MLLSAEQIDWGFITWSTDVLAAWGQVGGAIGTIVAVVFALRIARRERQDRHQEIQRTKQAEIRDIIVDIRSDSDAHSDAGYHFVLHNDSDHHLYEVAVLNIHWHTSNGLKSQGWRYRNVWFDPITFRGRIEPHSKTPFEVREFHFIEGPPPPPTPMDHWLIEFDFMDSYGTRWIRTGRAQPRQAGAVDTLGRFPGNLRKRRAAARLERAQRQLDDSG